jgi:hypothetical protein
VTAGNTRRCSCRCASLRCWKAQDRAFEYQLRETQLGNTSSSAAISDTPIPGRGAGKGEESKGARKGRLIARGTLASWFRLNEPPEAASPPSQFLERSRKDTHPARGLNKVKRRTALENRKCKAPPAPESS